MFSSSQRFSEDHFEAQILSIQTCRDTDGSFGSEFDPGYESDPMNGEGRLVPILMQVVEQNTKFPENSKCQGN